MKTYDEIINIKVIKYIKVKAYTERGRVGPLPILKSGTSMVCLSNFQYVTVDSEVFTRT